MEELCEERVIERHYVNERSKTKFRERVVQGMCYCRPRLEGVLQKTKLENDGIRGQREAKKLETLLKRNVLDE